eukprot:scaffold63505_cov67-Phaeocystis_antarctica.AAC.1
MRVEKMRAEARHLVAADDTSIATSQRGANSNQLHRPASLGVPQHAQQAARVARSRLAAPQSGDELRGAHELLLEALRCGLGRLVRPLLTIDQ